MVQFEKKRRREAAPEAQKATKKEREGWKLPSLEEEQEMEMKTEEGGVDLQTAMT